MSTDQKPIATSTPYRCTWSSSVLREKHPNNEVQSRQKPRNKKKVLAPSTFNSAKENVNKRSASSRHAAVDKEAKKRDQAIEAMKIMEQRRLRICKESIAEDIEKMTITECKDDSTEAKRLEAKRLKEKRIKAYLDEQEARKKKIEKAIADTTVKNASIKMQPRRLFSTYRTKNRCTFKPMKFNELLPTPLEVEEVKFEPFFPPNLMFISAYGGYRRVRNLIRYSQDEIRSLNPYGFYFM